MYCDRSECGPTTDPKYQHRVQQKRVFRSDKHLDFSGLAFLDSAALSGLLLLHRRTTQSGVHLHLDHRPGFLDRVLQVTGLNGHFAPSHSDATAGDPTRTGQTTPS